MNERIKELAKQACITIVPEPFDNASQAWNDTVEKFAELIIRECLSITKKQYNDTLPWGGVEDTIKEHFGVEE